MDLLIFLWCIIINTKVHHPFPLEIFRTIEGMTKIDHEFQVHQSQMPSQFPILMMLILDSTMLYSLLSSNDILYIYLNINT